MRSADTFPLFGPLLLRREAGRLSRKLRDGDLSTIGTLAGIAATCMDAGARQIARESLLSLARQDAIDALCNEALIWEDPFLRDLAREKACIPHDRGTKALFLYLSGQDSEFLRFDPEYHHPALAEGYAKANTRIRSRALQYAAGDSGNTRRHILAYALLGKDPEYMAKGWSYAEWELVMKTLTCEMSWNLLWRLASMAPPALSRAALADMNASGWFPGGDARQVFLDLIAHLPESWNAPLPEKPLISCGTGEGRVLHLSFSPDGTLLAAGSSDG
ncbi:MAG TPA: WD40 repeat domain-containing protein, partial [Methanoregula sp.]|nr:WD40 repeat domain-containing protein [Methanoregula sp.]